MIQSIYNISPDKLQQHGIDTILTDLDNTLIPWNHAGSNRDILHWVRLLQQYGINVIVISNNNPKRVRRAVADLGLPFVARAFKPMNIGIKRTLKRFSLRKDQVVMVGDQLLTDVWAANNCGIASIWVRPLVKTDLLPTRVNRRLETIVYWQLKKRYPELGWKGDID
ncbi:hypothetical protein FC87_GL000659 [Fructilactobacillus florum DSM 22689 = JCM 16035]|nr:hypothetical protein FC87_GL000659 [Fructilactobacillus florum DSM 22689 = JCM 16035]